MSEPTLERWTGMRAGGHPVDKLLTSSLWKAREVMCWLAKRVWPDGRLLGKIKKQVRMGMRLPQRSKGTVGCGVGAAEILGLRCLACEKCAQKGSQVRGPV